MKKFSFLKNISDPEILSKVREIVAEHFCLDNVQDLENNALFMKDLGADSLDVVELVMILEEQFEIHIGDEYTSQIKTVQEAADVITKLKSS
jgi:acyl carrier protein